MSHPELQPDAGESDVLAPTPRSPRDSSLRRRWAAALVASLVGSLVVTGCSATRDDEPAARYEQTYKASAASRSELGVVAWKATTDDGAISTVRGMRADGSVAEELQFKRFERDGVWRFVMRFTRGDDEASVRLRPTIDEGDPAIEIASTMPEGDDHPLQRGLELLQADMANGDADAAPTIDLFTSTQDLKPADVDQPPELVRKDCDWLHRCGILSQSLLCGKAAYGLTKCNPAGVLESGATQLVKLVGIGKFVTKKLPGCFDGLGSFGPSCLGSAPSGHGPNTTGPAFNHGCNGNDAKACDNAHACRGVGVECSKNEECCDATACVNGKCGGDRPDHGPCVEHCEGTVKISCSTGSGGNPSTFGTPTSVDCAHFGGTCTMVSAGTVCDY